MQNNVQNSTTSRVYAYLYVGEGVGGEKEEVGDFCNGDDFFCWE